MMIESRRLRWAGHLIRMEDRSAFDILTGKPTEKRSLGRPGHRWENNVRMDLEEIDVITSNLMFSAQDIYYWIALVMRH